MNDPTNDRKLEHLQIVEHDRESDRCKRYFDQIQLIHRALPEIDLENVDPSVEFLGKRLAFPLLISSMTGGNHDLIRHINENLATAAEATAVAIGVGSQRVMFTDPEAGQAFKIRDQAPGIVLLANLGGLLAVWAGYRLVSLFFPAASA